VPGEEHWRWGRGFSDLVYHRSWEDEDDEQPVETFSIQVIVR
jgi:hypothetical protein